MTKDPWRKDAACLGKDLAVFFPDKFQDAAAAKKICTTCPVRKECLAYALRSYTYEGVWGGFYGAEIKKKGRRYLDGTDECVTTRRSPLLHVAPYGRKVSIGYYDHQRSK